MHASGLDGASIGVRVSGGGRTAWPVVTSSLGVHEAADEAATTSKQQLGWRPAPALCRPSFAHVPCAAAAPGAGRDRSVQGVRCIGFMRTQGVCATVDSKYADIAGLVNDTSCLTVTKFPAVQAIMIGTAVRRGKLLTSSGHGRGERSVACNLSVAAAMP